MTGPARVAARPARARATGGWHAHAAARLAPVVEAAAVALDGPEGKEVAIHSDLHAGNILTGPDGGVHFVDWDLLRQGPAEFDLAPLAVAVQAGTCPAGHLEAALAARTDLDADRVWTLARFTQATAVSYYLAESLTQPDLLPDASPSCAHLHSRTAAERCCGTVAACNPVRPRRRGRRSQRCHRPDRRSDDRRGHTAGPTAAAARRPTEASR